MKSGKWVAEESVTSLICPSGDATMLCFEGQCAQAEASVVFPAAPKGQVFWIRRAKARRNITDCNLAVIGD